MNKAVPNPSISISNASQVNEENLNNVKKSSDDDKTFKYKGLDKDIQAELIRTHELI